MLVNSLFVFAAEKCIFSGKTLINPSTVYSLQIESSKYQFYKLAPPLFTFSQSNPSIKKIGADIK